MKSKYLTAFISIIILLSISNVNGISIKNKVLISYAASLTIYVDGNNTQGPWDGTLEHPYKTINEAIYNSTSGDTIFVFNGIYTESLTIDKSLNLYGENQNSTIIDGDYQNYVIQVITGNVNIKNFTIRNSGGYKGNAGLKIDSSSNTISDCTIYRTKTGIYLDNSGNNEINNCSLFSNGEGVFTKSSNNCMISYCCFYHNSIGLNIEESEGIWISSCYVSICSCGVLVNDSLNINISESAIYNNNDNGGGVLFTNSKDSTIFNCNINHNGFGMNIVNCSQIFFIKCNFFLNTHEAIEIGKNSTKSSIENCNITDNFRFGITAENSRSVFRHNNIYSNLFGIKTKKALCDARGNWWGSFFGPAIFERKTKDRIFSKLGFIRFFPWLLKKNQNAGSTWEIDYNKYDTQINSSRFKQIEIPGEDSDNDLAPNWWEEKWGYNPDKWDNHSSLDPDNDGLNNIEECFTDQWGSNPFQKDIFIEFDWMESSTSNISANKPPKEDIDRMTEVFLAHNITLHMDDGSLGGGEMINISSQFSLADLRDMYWDYFLHNDLNNPRKGIFRWCFISDFGPDPGFPGFSVIGWDNLDSFAISAQRIKDAHPSKTKGYIIISVTMHELGHTLGLLVDDHGGIDSNIATMPFTLEFFKYLRYKSCMNYLYTYHILNYSDGTRGRNNLDDWGNLDFNFFKNTHFEWPK